MHRHREREQSLPRCEGVSAPFLCILISLPGLLTQAQAQALPGSASLSPNARGKIIWFIL